MTPEEYAKSLGGTVEPVGTPSQQPSVSPEAYAATLGGSVTPTKVPTEGLLTTIAKAITPLGESIGTALAGNTAKAYEADTSARAQQLADAAARIIRNPSISAQAKQHALTALQSSGDANVIQSSGAFNETPAQTFGKGLQTLGSLSAGSGAAIAGGTKLGAAGTGIAGLAARTGAEAALGGSTFGLGHALAEQQTKGEMARSVITSAVTSGAMNVLAEGLGAGVKYLQEKMAPRVVNSVIRTKAADFRFGKNPGEEIVSRQIQGNTMEDYLSNINEARRAVGKDISDTLAERGLQGVKTDLTPVLGQIDDAIDKANRIGEPAYAQRLADLKSGFLNNFRESGGHILAGPGGNPVLVAPVEVAQSLKQDIGEATTWTGQNFDKQVNGVRVDMYGTIDKLIDKVAPAVTPLNDSYANLLTAEKALEKTLLSKQGINLIGLRTHMAALAAGAVGGASGGSSWQERLARGVTAAAVAEGLQSTALLSRGANAMRSAPSSAGFQVMSKLLRQTGTAGAQNVVQQLRDQALTSLQSSKQ